MFEANRNYERPRQSFNETTTELYIVPKPNRMNQNEANDIINQSSRPIIVITPESAESWMAMIRHLTSSLPHIPIMMPNHMSQKALNMADTIIVLGKNPPQIEIKDYQTILSNNTVSPGVNISLADFDEAKPQNAERWKQWSRHLMRQMGMNCRC